ncbi:MAG: hypothetical protein N2449_04260 [Bacteroidales bacterium]|nr:hypothetical protein [Bacteroidales bacterium]
MIKIVAVSYVNTLPFIYGITQSGMLNSKEYELIRLYPSLCTNAYYEKNADIILIPSGSFAQYPQNDIITSFCIAGYKHVQSVLLVAQKPIDQLKAIWLDYQSTTSVKLLQLLLLNHWKISPTLLSASEGFEQNIYHDTGGLIIGDRALELSSYFEYVYDLSYEWWKYTQLPFVFAYWVKTKDIDMEFLNRFEQALKWGVEHKHQSLALHSTFIPPYYYTYLDSYIQFELNNINKLGLIKFYELIQQHLPNSNF